MYASSIVGGWIAVIVMSQCELNVSANSLYFKEENRGKVCGKNYYYDFHCYVLLVNFIVDIRTIY